MSAPSAVTVPGPPAHRRPGLLLGGLERVGRWTLVRGRTVQGILAFALITLGVLFTKPVFTSWVIRPLVFQQLLRAGWRLLPLTAFVAAGLGFIVIGQTLSLLSRVGAHDYIGLIMVTVVVRELGPLLVVLLVLARAGAAQVIDLGMIRALGQVEALEALSIDPVHYLVVPRVVALAAATFSLTLYFILIALAGGYLFAYLQDVPLTPREYLRQIAGALLWEDFVLLSLKSAWFGIVVALLTCFHGLARPLHLQEVSLATTRAVVQSVVACVALDLVFISIYFIT